MNKSIESLKEELLNSRKRNERAEVILSNLLLLKPSREDFFIIPFDDVVVTVQTALEVLKTKSS